MARTKRSASETGGCLSVSLAGTQPLLNAIIADRIAGRPVQQVAYAFHAAFAAGIWDAVCRALDRDGAEALVLSGGVVQNAPFVEMIESRRRNSRPDLRLWINHRVPPNDGGLSLGQAAIAAAVTTATR